MADEHCKPINPRIKDLTGKRFGRLCILGLAPNPRSSRAFWLCRCDCGNIRTINGYDLRCGATTSCGCRQREVVSRRNFKHGCGGRNEQRTPEYKVWAGIKARCTNPNERAFANYGRRGISMCERWRNSFEAFLEDMGPKPSPKLTIDRINNNGNYEPGNCRWATRTTQARNKRNNRLLGFRGETLCLAEWAKRTGIPNLVIHDRLQRGWSVERALTEPARKCSRRDGHSSAH